MSVWSDWSPNASLETVLFELPSNNQAMYFDGELSTSPLLFPSLAPPKESQGISGRLLPFLNQNLI